MMNLGIRNAGIGVYSCFGSVLVMIGASTTSMIDGSHLTFWLDTLVLSSIIPLVSFLFTLTKGELFPCSLFIVLLVRAFL